MVTTNWALGFFLLNAAVLGAAISRNRTPTTPAA
jgi:hypothetical protein